MIGSHIIPRYYLEQFATKKKPSAKTGQFWVYAKGSEPRLGTPKSEGVENGYFGLPGETGELDESLEWKLAEMENEANDLLVMAGNQTFVWSIFYRQKMANYVALLYARTKARRDASAWVSGQNFERPTTVNRRRRFDVASSPEPGRHYWAASSGRSGQTVPSTHGGDFQGWGTSAHRFLR
jgi:hypothetical protein